MLLEAHRAEHHAAGIVTPPRLLSTVAHPGRHVRGVASAIPAIDVPTGSSKLVQALAALGVLRDTQQITWSQFLPKCQEHLDIVLEKIDRHYTDEQLEVTLKDECRLAKEFYITTAKKRTGMKSEADCHRYAHQLAEAREQELWNQSDQGYVDFCRSYFEYHGGGGEIPAEKPQAAKSPSMFNGSQIAFIAVTILGCVAFVMAVYVVLRSWS